MRRRIPLRESIAEGSQEMARIEPAILPVAVRILDEFARLKAALKRSVELKKHARAQSDRRLIHCGSTWKGAILGGPVPVRVLRFMHVP